MRTFRQRRCRALSATESRGLLLPGHESICLNGNYWEAAWPLDIAESEEPVARVTHCGEKTSEDNVKTCSCNGGCAAPNGASERNAMATLNQARNRWPVGGMAVLGGAANSAPLVAQTRSGVGAMIQTLSPIASVVRCGRIPALGSNTNRPLNASVLQVGA